MEKKLDKKELKKPDQFVSFWTDFSEKAGRFVAARGRQVAIGAAILAALIVSAVAFAQMRARGAQVASQALARVDRIATADLLPADSAAPPKDDSVPTSRPTRNGWKAP